MNTNKTTIITTTNIVVVFGDVVDDMVKYIVGALVGFVDILPGQL